MGGAALAALKDETVAGASTIQTPRGPVQVQATTEIVFPGAIRQSLQLPFGTITAYSDGASGWMQTPQGVVPMPPAQEAQFRQESATNVYWTLLHYQDPGYRVRLLAPETVNGRAAQVVQITTQGETFELLLDAASGQVLGKRYRTQAGLPAEVVEYFSDYRPVDGILCAFASRTLRDGKPFSESRITSLKLNTGLLAADLAKKP